MKTVCIFAPIADTVLRYLAVMTIPLHLTCSHNNYATNNQTTKLLLHIMKNIHPAKMCSIVTALSLGILLLCCTPLLAQKSPSVQDLYNKGRTALNARRYDEAIDAFTKVIEQRGRAATTPRLLRAHAYAYKLQPDKALVDLDSIIAWHTEDPKSISAEDIERAYFLRGEISSPTRGNSAAIKDFDAVMLIAPHNIRAYFKRGTLRTNMQDAQGAIDDFTVYIDKEKNTTKYQSDIALAFFARGVHYTGLQKYNAALADFNRAIDLRIDSVSVYFGRAMVKVSLHDTIGAIKDLSTYIGYEQKNAARGGEVASSLVLRGFLYFSVGDYGNAVVDLRKALTMPMVFKQKGIYSLHLVVGAALELQKRNEEAIAEYTHAVLASADAYEARLNRGALYLESEKISDAKTDFSYLIDVSEKKRDSLSSASRAILGAAYYNRAMSSQFEGELSAALQDLEKATVLVASLSDTTTDTDIWKTMGQILKYDGTLSPSLQDLDKISLFVTSFQNEISSADVWRAIGDVKYELNDFAGALTAYDKATVQQPDQPAIFYYNRALVYTKMGDSLTAIMSVTRAAELQPDNADFYSLRGDLKSGLGQYADALQDYTLAIRHDPKNPIHYFDRATVAAKLDNIKQMCEDIHKARTMGLEAAQSLYADMVKQGICK